MQMPTGIYLGAIFYLHNTVSSIMACDSTIISLQTLTNEVP